MSSMSTCCAPTPDSKALLIDSLVTPVVFATSAAWVSVSAAWGALILSVVIVENAGRNKGPMGRAESRDLLMKRCIDLFADESILRP